MFSFLSTADADKLASAANLAIWMIERRLGLRQGPELNRLWLQSWMGGLLPDESDLALRIVEEIEQAESAGLGEVSAEAADRYMLELSGIVRDSSDKTLS